MLREAWKRILSVFLTILMVLTSITIFPDTAQAAAAMLGEIKLGTDIRDIDPGFDPEKDVMVTFQFNKKAGMDVQNVDNNLPPWATNKDPIKNKLFQDLTKSGSALPVMTYYKIAQNKEKGYWYDLRAEVTGWKPTAYTSVDPNGNKIPPTLCVLTNTIGIAMVSCEYVTICYTYLIHNDDGTSREMTADEISGLHSLVTLSDLDGTQGFKIPQVNGLMGLYKQSGNQYITQDGNGLIVSTAGEETKTTSPWGWVSAYLSGGNSLSVSFYNPRNKSENYEAGKTYTQSLMGRSPAVFHYYFTAQSVFSVRKAAEMGLEKRVGEKGVGWEEAYPAESPETAYEIEDYKEFDYLLNAAVQTAVIDQTDYVVTDTLEDCLQIDDAAHVTVTDKDGKNVTGSFNVQVKGQTVTCSAKESYLSDRDGSFYTEGQKFLIRLRVHRKKMEDVRNSMQAWLDEDGYTFYVPNSAVLEYTDKTGLTKKYETEEVWVTDAIRASLKVEKDAKYDGWKVGDEVEYAVEVTQVKQDGYALNVEVTDRDIPPYLELINGSWEVSGPNNGTAASMSSLGENGWIVTCPLLQYGDSIVIRFKCRALGDSNGKDTINTVKATADNFMDDDGEQKYTGDDAEVWINSPELSVDKTANAYEYEVGDRVQYTVTVRNTRDYTVARNVVVSDISIPEGLQITEDSPDGTGVRVAFTPERAASEIGWPTADGTTAIVKQGTENRYSVERAGNAWTVMADYLPSDAAMTITFDCIASKYVNGIESQNQVSVTAENFVDESGNQRIAQDDAEVYVNTAAFSINKYVTDGNYEWQVGDHVPFDIIVRNINDENTQGLADSEDYMFFPEDEKARIGAAGRTVARNVVIRDTDIPEGFRLDTDTMSVEAVPQEINEEAQEPYNPENPAGPGEVLEGEIPSSEYPDEEIREDVFPAEEPQIQEDAEIQEELEPEAAYEYMELSNEEILEAAESLENHVEEVYETETYDEETYGEDPYEENGYGEETDAEDPYEENTDEESSYEEDYIGEAGYEAWMYEAEDENAETAMARELRPAEQMTVEGIPDSYENHTAGTADTSNQLDPGQYNETVTTPVKWNLETMGNGWQLKISDLPAGYDVRIHFTCEALEASNGQEGVNIGTVTADNAITKSDDSEAYVNTAVLSIQKEVMNPYAAGGAQEKGDGRELYEFRVGEDVEYRVTVHNVQPGSIARNLVIEDVSLPEGLVLKEEDGAITIDGIPSEYTNPIPGTEDTVSQTDPDHYKETERLPVGYQLIREGTGWRLFIDNLPCTENDGLNQWGQPVTITYHCTAAEEVNGWEIINTARASADNAAEVQDSERIWINSPVLHVRKEADKEEYSVGDTITYQADITQEQTGCVARNVVIRDRIATEGVKLQKNSIVLLDKDGNKFHIPDENILVTGNSFTIYTGMHLIKEAGYLNWDAGNGGLTEKGAFNPIQVDHESRLTVEYAVEVTDNDLAGELVHNVLQADSDEQIPGEDEEEVLVDGPALDITKESDKAEYLVGETGVYKVTVRQLRENVTARQVVIRDSFNTDGVAIEPESFLVRMNGEEITGAKVTAYTNGFVIETGRDMKIEDKLEISYRVQFLSPSLDGRYVTNTVTAKGSNTKEETQDNTVIVVDESPSIDIRKRSDKTYYKVGETGHYTVTVTQTEKGATARNVIIKDRLDAEGARILPGTILIRNDAGRVMDDAEIEYSDTRYAIYTGKDLGYKETFTVTYDVLFESEALAGTDILNVARATCDNNKVEQKDPGPLKISDGLTVYKYADPVTCSLVKRGDTVTYFITVTNTSGEAKETILVKDKIPEYTEYVPGSAKGEASCIAKTMELKGSLYAAFILKDLPAGGEQTVSFQVKVREDAPEDAMLLNVGQVRETKASVDDMTEDTWNHTGFRNTNETVHYLDTRWVMDPNTVRIDGGALSIEKTSDKANYAVGETGHYTLTVTQGKEGAVSKNVVIKDTLKKEGADIQTGTIKVLKNGQTLSLAEISGDVNGFTIHTHADLAYGEQMTVTYDVLFRDASLSGKSVHNIALTKGDETPEGEEPRDDNTVTVGKAGLDIRKSSDKEEYQVGETARYTLEVRTTADDFTAENVIIKDVMKQQGANLIAGTVKVYLDEKRIEKAEVQEIDNGFIVSTHTDLSGSQVMKVTYEVTMEKASLAGRKIQNTAAADADNTSPAETTHTVTVPGAEKPEEPEKPEDPADPQTTPTPSPVPSKPAEKEEPVLTITKKADRSEAEPGSTVAYTLEVKNTGNTTARDVVVIDNLKNNKAILQKDTIRAYLQDKGFTPKKLSAVSSGFRMETGQDLKKGQSLTVTYQVKLDSTIRSSEIRNVASASADNADRTETEYTLYIPSNGSGTSDPGSTGSTGTTGLKDTSSSLKGNVQTGDRSPVKLIVIMGILGAAGLLAYFRGRRKGRR